MQTLVQVICSKKGGSLRDTIIHDPRVADFEFSVEKKQQPGRPGGWSKIHSKGTDRAGSTLANPLVLGFGPDFVGPTLPTNTRVGARARCRPDWGMVEFG